MELRKSAEKIMEQTDIQYLQRIIYGGFLHRLAICKQNAGRHFELFE